MGISQTGTKTATAGPDQLTAAADSTAALRLRGPNTLRFDTRHTQNDIEIMELVGGFEA